MLRHQRTAKYCLQQQGEQQHIDTFKCEYCEKVFYRTDNFAKHQTKCGPESKQATDATVLLEKFMVMVQDMQQHNTTLIKEQGKQNNKLVKEMFDIVNVKGKKSRVEELQPITDDDLSAFLDSLSLEFIRRGVQGYADYAGNYPFKGKVICTDRSRKKIQYKSADGTVTADGRALAVRFFQAIEKKNTAIINKEYSLLHQKLDSIVKGDSDSDEDVSDILSKATFMQNMLIKIQNAAQGKDEEFTQLFLSHLSKLV